MQTTLEVDPDLLERAQRRADADGTTLSVIIERALRTALVESETRRAQERIDPPTFTSPEPIVLPAGVTWDRIGHIFEPATS